jgi:hypothetical protein
MNRQLKILAVAEKAVELRKQFTTMTNLNWSKTNPNNVLRSDTRWVTLEYLLSKGEPLGQVVLDEALRRIENREMNPVSEMRLMEATGSVVPSVLAACIRRLTDLIAAGRGSRTVGVHPRSVLFETIDEQRLLRYSDVRTDPGVIAALKVAADMLLASSPGVSEMEHALCVLSGEDFERVLAQACKVGTAVEIVGIWDKLRDDDCPGYNEKTRVILEVAFPDVKFLTNISDDADPDGDDSDGP